MDLEFDKSAISMLVSVSRLYELCTQKYTSSVQVVYTSKVYLYMNLYKMYYVSVYCVLCVSCLYELSFSQMWCSWNDFMKLKIIWGKQIHSKISWS